MIATQSSVNTELANQIAAAAAAAGLQVLSTEPTTNAFATPTLRFVLALAGDESKTQTLELSQSFHPTEFASDLSVYLKESVQRLQSPRPDLYMTLAGLPLRFSAFSWPFHESTAGADTSLVHGQASLIDGHDSPLHAKLSASMTVTFREALRAPEQPFAESFIYNAVRKTFDQGQLELVKSGNRQPVQVTTRYYSARHNKFVFTDTSEAQRTAVPRGQDLLALRGVGWRCASLAAGPARCSVPERDGSGPEGFRRGAGGPGADQPVRRPRLTPPQPPSCWPSPRRTRWNCRRRSASSSPRSMKRCAADIPICSRALAATERPEHDAPAFLCLSCYRRDSFCTRSPPRRCSAPV